MEVARIEERTAIEAAARDTPLHLVALDTLQLQGAHTQMLAFVRARRDKIDVDIDVESAALDAAARSGFTTAPFERRINALAKQSIFYEKIQAGVEAGYVIVPNFDMDVFAIRTTAKSPRQTIRTGRWNRFVEPAKLLEPGDGSYVNPMPRIVTHESPDADGKVHPTQRPDDEFLELEFPIALARPEIITRAGEAMARKLFDEIGFAQDSTARRNGDPILLGRLLNPRKNRPAVTFFLGWYFDPSVLG